ncbi:MAG: cyclic nucleotide-binding domain-containing protein [Armatimonadetes bacterium]|nr:cyclic nucleotide-binding domain-containing protein [Armatimonadota bacterium]
MAELLSQQPCLKELDPASIEFMAGCAANTFFPQGTALLREGQRVEKVYLLRHGRVGIQVHVPGKGPKILDSVGPGELIGWSAFGRPGMARMDLVSLEDVRAISLDAECLARKCESDPKFGYAMLVMVVDVLQNRLQSTILQLLDLYGDRS